MNWARVVLMLYPQARELEDFFFVQEGTNEDHQRLGKWNAAILGPQPSMEFLQKKAVELAPQIALAECLDKRRNAYVAESDPLLPEALYDRFGPPNDPVKFNIWVAKVEEIKTRIPKPESIKEQ